MKKCLFIICVILSFSLLFIGCNRSENPGTTSTTTSITTSTTQQTVPCIDHTMGNFEAKNDSCFSSTLVQTCTKCGYEEIYDAVLILPQHTWNVVSEDGITVHTCNRCNKSYTFLSEIKEFSYAQTLEEHKTGDPGVQHENFLFSYEGEIKTAINAILRADSLLTVEYDMISVSFDSNSGVWCVEFYKQDLVGGSQSIYFDKDGSTCYIIYGE